MEQTSLFNVAAYLAKKRKEAKAPKKTIKKKVKVNGNN